MREDLGLTQSEVAANLEITQSQLSKFELGKREPDLETIGKIADYYHTSIDYFFGHVINVEIRKDYNGKN